MIVEKFVKLLPYGTRICVYGATEDTQSEDSGELIFKGTSQDFPKGTSYSTKYVWYSRFYHNKDGQVCDMEYANELYIRVDNKPLPQEILNRRYPQDENCEKYSRT